MQTRPLVPTFALVVTFASFTHAALAEVGDPIRGERTFQYCFSCHSVDPNEQAQLEGPSLYRIVGRPAASLKGFNYSDAMKKRGAEGLKWNAAVLNSYIADPQSIVPGTRMSAAPLRDDQARADLIAYLAKSGPYRP
jgi:cytochrome c